MEDDFPRVSEKAKQGLDSRSSIQRLVFYNAVKFRVRTAVLLPYLLPIHSSID